MMILWPFYVALYGTQLCVQAVYLLIPQLFKTLALDQRIYAAFGLSNDISWLLLHLPLVARWVVYQLVPCSSNFGELWSDYSLTLVNIWNIAQLIAWSLTGPFGAIVGNFYESRQDASWFTSVYRGSPFIAETNQTTFYINGICTTRSILISNCKKLEHQLNRRVIGIFNPSYGILSDVIECVIQRNLGLTTTIVSVAEEAIFSELVRGHKVELIAHSQGGIIAALAVFGVAQKWQDWRTGHPKAPSLSKLLTVITYASAAKSFPDCGVRPPSCVDAEQLPESNIVHFVNYACTDLRATGFSRLADYAGDLIGLNTTSYRVNRPLDSIERDLNLGVYGKIFVSKNDKAGHFFGAFYDVDVEPYPNYIQIADSFPRWRLF